MINYAAKTGDLFPRKGLVIFGFGHRHDYLCPTVRSEELLVQFSVQLLKDRMPSDRTLTPVSVVVAMQRGFDLSLAIAAKQLGIPLFAIEPYAGYQAKWSPTDLLRLASAQQWAIQSGSLISVTKQPYSYSALLGASYWVEDYLDTIANGNRLRVVTLCDTGKKTATNERLNRIVAIAKVQNLYRDWIAYNSINPLTNMS